MECPLVKECKRNIVCTAELKALNSHDVTCSFHTEHLFSLLTHVLKGGKCLHNHLDGKSLRQIARELGISRDTVTKAVAPTPFRGCPDHIEHGSGRCLVPIRPASMTCWTKTLACRPKQRLTAHRIYEMLRDEGFPGCESRVRQYVADENRPSIHQIGSFRWRSSLARMPKWTGVRPKCCFAANAKPSSSSSCGCVTPGVSLPWPFQSEAGMFLLRPYPGVPAFWRRSGTPEL